MTQDVIKPWYATTCRRMAYLPLQLAAAPDRRAELRQLVGQHHSGVWAGGHRLPDHGGDHRLRRARDSLEAHTSLGGRRFLNPSREYAGWAFLARPGPHCAGDPGDCRRRAGHLAGCAVWPAAELRYAECD